MEEARKEIKNMVVETTEKVLNKELDDKERERYSNAATKELAERN